LKRALDKPDSQAKPPSINAAISIGHQLSASCNVTVSSAVVATWQKNAKIVCLGMIPAIPPAVPEVLHAKARDSSERWRFSQTLTINIRPSGKILGSFG
jgi:hypothetical protein